MIALGITDIYDLLCVSFTYYLPLVEAAAWSDSATFCWWAGNEKDDVTYEQIAATVKVWREENPWEWKKAQPLVKPNKLRAGLSWSL